LREDNELKLVVHDILVRLRNILDEGSCSWLPTLHII
jgi:hypothetical protein